MTRTSTYTPPPHIADLMRAASDHAIYEILQQIAATVDDDGNIDFNAILHRAVPYGILLFLMRCPPGDLAIMAGTLRAEAAKLSEGPRHE